MAANIHLRALPQNWFASSQALKRFGEEALGTSSTITWVIWIHASYLPLYREIDINGKVIPANFMEDQPNPSLPVSSESDISTPDDNATLSVGDEVLNPIGPEASARTAELSDVRAADGNERTGDPTTLRTAEAYEAMPFPDDARQNPPTPITELLRQDGNIHSYSFKLEVPNSTIIGTAVSQDSTLPRSLYSSLRLPNGFIKSNTGRDIFNDVRDLIRNHAMLSERQSRLVAYWAIATWFTDFLSFVPTLVVTGHAFSADPLLRVLECVCRRPVLLAGISPASLRAITCNQVMPTLLIRTSQLNKTMAALLDASNRPGYFISSGKDVWQFYGAKCIYMREAGDQEIVGSHSIHVRAARKGSELRTIPLKNEHAQDIQNQLLYYRLVMHDRVAASNFNATGMLPELCAMAQVLGAPLEGDPELQKGVIELLNEFNEQVRVDRSCELNAMVLKGVLSHCHQVDPQRVFVREIAATVNEFYREEGESLRISNERVGHVLKNLGLYTRRLGNAGRGLILDRATQNHAHELCYANEVLPESDEGPACGYCHKLQLLDTQEVV